MSAERIAAIDLGSNSFLLTIAERKADGILTLIDECRVTGLAKRLTKEGFVSEDAMTRAAAALKEYRSLLDQYKVSRTIAVATESLRRPKNGEEVKKILERELDQSIQIIKPEREAQLSFWSVKKDPHCPPGPILVFDIGGASTELIAGDRQPNCLCSLKLGSVVLTEMFGLEEINSYADALVYCKEMISKSSVAGAEAKTGIGVAGTITSLLAVHLGISNYDRSKVHGLSIPKKDLYAWIEKVFAMSLDERKQIVGLAPERADVFGGGLVIALALVEYFDWSELFCFDTGVRYGLIYETFGL